MVYGEAIPYSYRPGPAIDRFEQKWVKATQQNNVTKCLLEQS